MGSTMVGSVQALVPENPVVLRLRAGAAYAKQSDRWRRSCFCADCLEITLC